MRVFLFPYCGCILGYMEKQPGSNVEEETVVVKEPKEVKKADITDEDWENLNKKDPKRWWDN